MNPAVPRSCPEEAYDADGSRVLRFARDHAGTALLSLRDGEGRTHSEFVDEPSGGLKLVLDFVNGVGQFLVERQVTSAPPQMLLGSPLVSGGSYCLTVTDGSAATSYELDIRTASGLPNRPTGLWRDAARQVHVAAPRPITAPTFNGCSTGRSGGASARRRCAAPSRSSGSPTTTGLARRLPPGGSASGPHEPRSARVAGTE